MQIAPIECVSGTLLDALALAVGRRTTSRDRGFESGFLQRRDRGSRESAIARQEAGASRRLTVEMGAAALYAFATAPRGWVLRFAHVTNQMARIEGDSEKRAAAGIVTSLTLISCIAACSWASTRS